MTALHVSHRPQTFADVLGQGDAIKSLKRAVEDRRAQTFLFTGPPGTGKTTLARILAQTFADGQGTVANCEEFNAASNSGADAVRAVINRTRYRAIGSSPVKAIIVDECHRLSGNAWDVLLKATEEPPPHVFWMFCSTNPGKIPKTIQTRCLRYDLKPVPEELILRLLIKVCDAEKFDTSDEVLEAIAENAGGSPRQSLVYLEECLYCETASDARKQMRSAGTNKDVGDLCRFLVKGRGLTWAEATKYLKALDGTMEAESARIVIVDYLTKALLGTKDDGKATALLGILECFRVPYVQSDKLAPLAYSLGMAIGLDRG